MNFIQYDEGFIEQQFKLPYFMKDWTNEQKAGFIQKNMKQTVIVIINE